MVDLRIFEQRMMTSVPPLAGPCACEILLMMSLALNTGWERTLETVRWPLIVNETSNLRRMARWSSLLRMSAPAPLSMMTERLSNWWRHLFELDGTLTVVLPMSSCQCVFPFC